MMMYLHYSEITLLIIFQNAYSSFLLIFFWGSFSHAYSTYSSSCISSLAFYSFYPLTLYSYAACFSAFFRYNSFFFPFKLLIVYSRVRLELLLIFLQSNNYYLFDIYNMVFLKDSSVILPDKVSSCLLLIIQFMIITFSIDFLCIILLNLHITKSTYCKKSK